MGIIYKNGIKYGGGDSYIVEDKSLIPVIGTQTSSTGSWTGNIDIPHLYNGLTIAYFLPYAPSGNATLNLTLNDGSTTGPINCYYNTGRLTTHYAKGSNIIMTFWGAGSISVDGTATTDDRWVAQADYNSNTDTWRNIQVNGTQKLGTAINTGALNFKDGENTSISYDGGVKVDAIDTTYDFSAGSSIGYFKVEDNNGEEEEITPYYEVNTDQTSILPLTFTAKGGIAVDWEIKGNDDNGTENMFDIGTSASDYEHSNIITEIDSHSLSINIVRYGGTWTYRNKKIPTTGEHTVSLNTDKKYSRIFIALRNQEDTDWLTNSDTSISGCIYNAVYHGWFKELGDADGNITTSVSIPNCLYWQLGIGYNSNNEYIGTSGTLSDIMLVKGSTAPDHYIPYQQGVGERTVNLYDKNTYTKMRAWVKSDGEIQEGSLDWQVSDYIPIEANENYTISNVVGFSPAYCLYDSNKNYISGNTYANNTKIIFQAPANAAFARFSVKYGSMSGVDPNIDVFMVTKGSTAPSSYVPFGYEIPIKVTKHKTYPIQWALKGKAVRDQVTSTKGNETLTWDVIGIDHDECYYADGRRAAHSVTLQLHDCFPTLQFDESEALFYAESAMPAGTYHFTLREQPWYAADVNKTFEFTLTQALAAGSQICVTNAYNAAITSGKVKTYSGGTSTTAIETVDITEGNGGTDLGDVRNALVGQNTNSIQRTLLGSNNWANSAMRQWLNSSAEAGSVWTPKTKFDRPPSWVSSIAGFLNGMDEDFVKAAGTVKKTTALNTVTDGGGKVESDERFFLLSSSEVYGGNEVAGGEGAAYSYYADYSDLSGAGTGADTNRIKYINNAVQYWWLRSPSVPNARNVRNVNTKGTVDYTSASNSFGVAPAICIPMDEVYDCNEVDIYIGTDPLTAGETVSKTSTGVDIELFNGENTVSTSLYNKPEMTINYLHQVDIDPYINSKIPTALKNPYALTINYNTTKSFDYDGSTAKSLSIKAGDNITLSGDTDGNITINGTANTWTALVGATSSSNGSVGYINAIPPKEGYNTKFFRADGTWAIPDYIPNTDEKVKQTNNTNNSSYRILLSNSANDTEETNGVKKSAYLLFNPNSKTLTTTNLSITKINDVTVGSTPKFTDTTYTLSTGDSNGQIKVTPSNGNAYNVDVKGLGSNAYSSTAYLPLTGGTVTGAINIKSSNLDRDGEAPTDDQTGKSLYFGDKDDNGVGRIYTVQRKTNNKKDLFMSVYNASGTSNSIGIRILDDGTPSYYLSSPSAFRDTLDNVTYIGANTITSSQVIIADGTDGKLKSSGYTINKSVPSNAVFTDTNTKVNMNLATPADTGYTVYYPASSGNLTEAAQELYKHGNLRIGLKAGTSSQDGYTRIRLGNETASGTAGNSAGELLLYSTDNGYSVLRQATGTSSTGITIYLPPKAGTLFDTGNLAAGDNITLTESNGVYSINGTANTDTKVSQTATTTSANYEILFSATADNTTRTEGARKTSGLKYNPDSDRLWIGRPGTSSGSIALYGTINGVSSYGVLKQPYNPDGNNVTHTFPTVGGYVFNSGNVSAGAGITISASGDRYTIKSKNKIYLYKTHTSLFSDINDDSFRNCKYFKIYYKDSNNCNYNCITMNMDTNIFPEGSGTSYVNGNVFTLSCVGDVNKTYLRTATFHFATKSGGGTWKLVFNSSFLWDPSQATDSSLTWTSTKQTSYSKSYIKIIKLEYFWEDT